MAPANLGDLIDQYLVASEAWEHAKAEYDHAYALFSTIKHKIQRSMHSAPTKAYEWNDKIYLLLDGELRAITPVKAEEASIKS